MFRVWRIERSREVAGAGGAWRVPKSERVKQGELLKFENRVLGRYGPAQVGFDHLSLHTPT
jgi:hypothetical protein